MKTVTTNVIVVEICMRMSMDYVYVITVSVKMVGFRTLKELRRRALAREKQVKVRIKIMNWLIVTLCLVIVGVALHG